MEEVERNQPNSEGRRFLARDRGTRPQVASDLQVRSLNHRSPQLPRTLFPSLTRPEIEYREVVMSVIRSTVCLQQWQRLMTGWLENPFFVS